LTATGGLSVEITFTHTGGATDWVYVLLDNGTPRRWPWPSFDAKLPYDLVHYLVETRLGARHGFWGLVADGTNFGYLSFAADQIRAGLTPTEPPSGIPVDLTELIQVECVVQALVVTAEQAGETGEAAEGTNRACLRRIRQACAERGVPVLAALDARSAGAPEKAIGELRTDLAELTARWRALAAGRSLVLPYSR
jgi:hypothetical protein